MNLTSRRMTACAKLGMAFLFLSSVFALNTVAQIDLTSECLPFPEEIEKDVRWETKTFPDMLYCKAVLTDSGAEAFSLTISRDSPFKSRRSDRAESFRFKGQELYWYKAADPYSERREILIRINEDRVMHVYVASVNAQTRSRYLNYAQLLLAAYADVFDDPETS